MIKLADLVFASFFLLLIICYLVLLWWKELKHWLSLLFTKFRFNPIYDSIPKQNEQEDRGYQNTNKYGKQHRINPRMLIKPILNNSPNYHDDYQGNNYRPSGILLPFTHISISLHKSCMGIYHLTKSLSTKWKRYHMKFGWNPLFMSCLSDVTCLNGLFYKEVVLKETECRVYLMCFRI